MHRAQMKHTNGCHPERSARGPAGGARSRRTPSLYQRFALEVWWSNQRWSLTKRRNNQRGSPVKRRGPSTACPTTLPPGHSAQDDIGEGTAR